MKFTELLAAPFKKAKGRKLESLFIGNRIYYVDDYGMPHTGMILATDAKHNRVGVGYLTNYTGISSRGLIESKTNEAGVQDWVPMSKVTKTLEIDLGQESCVNQVYRNRSYTDLQYKNMPKRKISLLRNQKVIYNKKRSDIEPVRIYENCFVKIFDSKDLYMVVLAEYVEMMPLCRYVLVNFHGDILYPAFPMYDGYLNGFFENLKPKSVVVEKMRDDGLRVVEKEEIQEVWEPDPGYLPRDYMFNPDHMTRSYIGERKKK